MIGDVALQRSSRAARYGSRSTVLLVFVARDVLYVFQQLGHLHSTLTPPCVSTCRTTRQPYRMLRRVDESGSF
jgi:hypothetical protein